MVVGGGGGKKNRTFIFFVEVPQFCATNLKHFGLSYNELFGKKLIVWLKIYSFFEKSSEGQNFDYSPPPPPKKKKKKKKIRVPKVCPKKITQTQKIGFPEICIVVFVQLVFFRVTQVLSSLIFLVKFWLKKERHN